MIRLFTILLGSICLYSLSPVMAQTPERGCGTETFHELRMQEDPAYAAQIARLDRQLMQSILHGRDAIRRSGDSTVYTIPVVFHVLHQNGSENISSQRISQEIQNLNDGFRNRGIFDRGVGEDVQIEFCLASVDPQGNPTSGIERIETDLTDVDSYGENYQLRQRYNWDPSRYLNLYTTRRINFGGTAIAGVAIFPVDAGKPEDGITILAELIGVPNFPIESATMIHEVGHYLGLYHPFQGGCENFDCMLQGDRVCDTPPDDYIVTFEGCGSNNNCSTDADDPRSLNPFKTDVPDRNDLYMDYNGRNCRRAFSEGQRERMRAVMETLRASLLQSSACQVPMPYDAGLRRILTPRLTQCSPALSPKVLLANFGLVPLRTVNIRYQLDQGTVKTLGWAGNLGYTAEDTVALPGLALSPGSHHLKVYTDLPNGQAEASPYNDTLETTFSYSPSPTLPFSVDFENGVPEAWIIDNPEGLGWELTDQGCSYPSGGNKALWMDNSFFFAGGFEDAFLSPQIDLGYYVNTRLSFEVAYGFDPSFGTSERLMVEVSTDCGETFISTPLYTRTRSGLATRIISTDTVEKWAPATCSDWRREEVSLNLFDGQQVVIRFAYTKEENGYPLYLDNIRIEGDAAPWTALEEVNPAFFRVYPNPGKGSFFIEMDSDQAMSLDLQLTDLPGREVLSRRLNRDALSGAFVVETDGIPAGVYLLRVKNELGMGVKKLVIQ